MCQISRDSSVHIVSTSNAFARVHLPNEQSVVFYPTADAYQIEDASSNSASTLTQWFQLNSTDSAGRMVYTPRPVTNKIFFCSNLEVKRQQEIVPLIVVRMLVKRN
jgi:hypothetical protein